MLACEAQVPSVIGANPKFPPIRVEGPIQVEKVERLFHFLARHSHLVSLPELRCCEREDYHTAPNHIASVIVAVV